jgi:hemerythrin
MSLIVWDESLSVGNDQIDQEHKKLIAMINDLDQAMREMQGRATLDRLIEDLIDYSRYHFRTEERYFVAYGYPNAEEHTRAHAYFMVQASKFKREFEQGKLTISIEMLDFLTDWLRQHIMISDHHYAKFFEWQQKNTVATQASG